jgi:glycosyltransferase involved in cell wall biosynthesis
MICAHEPTLDPRIRWEAEGAAHRFAVSVLGFNRDDGSLPQDENVDGYRIVRLKPNQVSGAYYFWRLKDVVSNRVRVPIGIVAVLLWPILVLSEILLLLLRTTARTIVRWATRLVTVSLLFKVIRSSTVPGLVRGRLIARVQYIVVVLRVQFATATSLFWNHLRDAAEKPDVIHCNDLDTLLVGVLAKQRYGCRLIFDAHEFYPQSDPDGKWLDITFFSILERFLIRKADAVVTVNPPLAAAMRNAYSLERVYSVPNAEPWTEARPKPAAGSEIARLAEGRTRFLFQGRFTPGRGIDELIEGWARLDGRRAALFLRGPDNMWRQAAMTLARRLGLLDHSVYFLDAVPEDRLVAAAAEAEIGIIPYKPLIINDRLCCPNKLSQYLHAGLMVIANDLPYVKSVLTEAGAGLFYDSTDLDTLRTVVEQIVGDPELLSRSRENALRFARDRFNWQVQSQTLYELYRSAAGVEQTVPSGAVAQAATCPGAWGRSP